MAPIVFALMNRNEEALPTKKRKTEENDRFGGGTFGHLDSSNHKTNDQDLLNFMILCLKDKRVPLSLINHFSNQDEFSPKRLLSFLLQLHSVSKSD